MRSVLAARTEAQKEAVRPAKIEVVFLTEADCEDCFPIKTAWMELYKSLPAEVTSEKEVPYDSDEGKLLAERYQIANIPALIVRGEIDKENIASFIMQAGKRVEDAAVLSPSRPVYRELASGELVGRVRMKVLKDASCASCYDPSIHQSILLKQFGMSLAEIEEYDAASREGRELISLYEITQLPTIILSQEATRYPSLKEAWGKIGSIETDGSLVFRDVQVLGMPYLDLQTQSIIDPKLIEKKNND